MAPSAGGGSRREDTTPGEEAGAGARAMTLGASVDGVNRDGAAGTGASVPASTDATSDRDTSACAGTATLPTRTSHAIHAVRFTSGL